MAPKEHFRMKFRYWDGIDKDDKGHAEDRQGSERISRIIME